MTWLIAKWALFKGLPKWAHIAMAVIAGVISIGIWLGIHDRNIIKADRAAVEAATAKLALEAERNANDADAKRQAENQANDDQTRKDIADAVENDPEGGKSAAGPVTRSAIDSLRQR